MENRFKRVASQVMEEIKQVEPAQRLEFIQKNCEKQVLHALFKHSLPTDAEKKFMRDRNQLIGHKQPKGAIDIDKFEARGSFGMSLQPHVAMLRDPITEEQMMRNYLLAKTAASSALRALSNL